MTNNLLITDYINKIVNELLLINFENENRPIFTDMISDELSEKIFTLYYPTKKFPKGNSKETKKKNFMTISTTAKNILNNVLMKEFIKEFIVALKYYMQVGCENNEIINIIHFKELIFTDPNFTYKYDMSLLEYLYNIYIHQNYYTKLHQIISKNSCIKKIKNVKMVKNNMKTLDVYVLKLFNILNTYNKDLYNTIFDGCEEKKFINISDKVFETFQFYLINFILYLSYEIFNYCQCFTKVINPFNMKYDVFIYILTMLKTPTINLNDKIIVMLRNYVVSIKEESKQKKNIKNEENSKIKANKE